MHTLIDTYRHIPLSNCCIAYVLFICRQSCLTTTNFLQYPKCYSSFFFASNPYVHSPLIQCLCQYLQFPIIYEATKPRKGAKKSNVLDTSYNALQLCKKYRLHYLTCVVYATSMIKR